MEKRSARMGFAVEFIFSLALLITVSAVTFTFAAGALRSLLFVAILLVGAGFTACSARFLDSLAS